MEGCGMRIRLIFFVFLFFATASTQAQEPNSVHLSTNSSLSNDEDSSIKNAEESQETNSTHLANDSLLNDENDLSTNDTEESQATVIPVEDYLFTVQDDGRDIASAFLYKDQDGVWMATSYHVIEGAEKLVFINMNDPDCTYSLPTEIQIATDRDAVRFAVDQTNGLAIADDFNFDDEVIAFGNSDGRGVITKNKGRVLGKGSGEVEVDCDIIPGNSGGPVVDKDQNVLGIAAYIVPSESEKIDDALKEAGAGEKAMLTERKAILKGTRYGETRRFAVQVKGVTWQPVTHEELDAFYEIKLAANEAFDTIWSVIYCENKLSIQNGCHGKFLSSSWIDDYESTIQRKAEPYYSREKQKYVCYYNISDKTRKEWFNDLANAGKRRARKIQGAISTLSTTYLIDKATDLNKQLSKASDALKEISRQ